jgi:hypothetical protein
MEGSLVMNRSSFRRLLLAIAVSSLAIPSVQAGWPELHHAGKLDKARNNYWPQPFRAMDAAATVAPFDIMRANGWRQFNTINGCLFDERGQLTDAGKIQLQRVIRTSPVDKRTIYVAQAGDEGVTAARVESIELAISDMLPSGELPTILVTRDEQPVSSGAYQTALNRALIRSVPTPRLPVMATSSPSAGEAGN